MLRIRSIVPMHYFASQMTVCNPLASHLNAAVALNVSAMRSSIGHEKKTDANF
jgi:hypothetical protein